MIELEDLARERRFERALAEAAGGDRPPDLRARILSAERTRHRTRPRAPRTWAAVLCIALALAVVFAVARRGLRDETAAAQDQAPAWHEADRSRGLSGVPDEATHLRCLGFDDAAMAGLERLTKLRALDLGREERRTLGTQSFLAPPMLTDAGLAHLARCTELRWLSLKRCPHVRGKGLVVLERMPLLERLELGGFGGGVGAEALERLHLLPSLRELDLGGCIGFPGEALGSVAKIVGLRKLDLSFCGTVRGVDVARLATLRELVELDLRGCAGRATAPPRPAWGHELFDGDRVGVTEEAVKALAKLPLVTLRLGGCAALGDGIGPTLGAMKTLRSLDLSGLPLVEGALLAALPAALVELELRDSEWLDRAALERLGALRSLQALRLGDNRHLDDRALEPLARLGTLRELGLGSCTALGPVCLETLVKLPLRRLDLQRTSLAAEDVARAAGRWPGCEIKLPDGGLLRVPTR
jgi:hypothetical protein